MVLGIEERENLQPFQIVLKSGLGNETIKVQHYEKLFLHLIKQLRLNTSQFCIKGVLEVIIIVVFCGYNDSGDHKSMRISISHIKILMGLLYAIDQDEGHHKNNGRTTHVLEDAWIKEKVRSRYAEMESVGRIFIWNFV